MTATRSLAVAFFVVAATVTVAGCGAVPTPMSEPANATTASAAASPTGAQTAERVVPGVTADGVVDATALVQAHVRALTERSFTVTRRVRGVDTATNETTRELTATWRIDARDGFRGTYESRWVTVPQSLVCDRRPPEAVSTYRADETVSRRIVTDAGDAGDENVTFDRPPLTDTVLRLTPALHRAPVAALGDAEEVSVQSVTRDGTQRYRIAARLPENRIRSNRTVELLVTPEGRVTDIRHRFVRDATGSVVTRTIRFRAVGETRVERPAWYETTQNATSGETA